MTVGRTRQIGIRLTAVGAAVVACAAVDSSPAQAQGELAEGAGNHVLIWAAGATGGAPAAQLSFGEPGDELLVGDFVDAAGAVGGDGRDDLAVRRGNTFTVRGSDLTFSFGDPGDTVLVGDWDGDGTDTLAVRRGSVYLVRDELTSGPATSSFAFGEATDVVLVGNWDGDTSAAGASRPLTTDTLMIRRGDHYFVRNTPGSGPADFDFRFGLPDDVVLAGDWASGAVPGDGADQLAVRRGNTYRPSAEIGEVQLKQAAGVREPKLGSGTPFVVGTPTDIAVPFALGRGGARGDGIAVRRSDSTSGTDTSLPPVAAEVRGPTRSYAVVGDSISAGLAPDSSITAPGPNSWLNGEVAQALRLVGGWVKPGATTADMLAAATPVDADVLVLLGGTNDLLVGTPWLQTAENLRAIAATVDTPRVLLVGLEPIDAHPDERRLFNANLAALAVRQGWDYMDPWTGLAEGDGWAAGASVEGIHPTPESAIVAGQVIADATWQTAGR